MLCLKTDRFHCYCSHTNFICHARISYGLNWAALFTVVILTFYRSWSYIVYAKVAIRRICNFSWIYVTITVKSLRYLPIDEDGNTNIQFKYICSTIKLKWARFQHRVMYIVKLVQEKRLHLRHTLKFIAGYQITCTVQHNMRSNQKLQMATMNLWSPATLFSFIFFVSHFIFFFFYS